MTRRQHEERAIWLLALWGFGGAVVSLGQGHWGEVAGYLALPAVIGLVTWVGSRLP